VLAELGAPQVQDCVVCVDASCGLLCLGDRPVASKSVVHTFAEPASELRGYPWLLAGDAESCVELALGALGFGRLAHDCSGKRGGVVEALAGDATAPLAVSLASGSSGRGTPVVRPSLDAVGSVEDCSV